jgi:hypothetical protein
VEAHVRTEQLLQYFDEPRLLIQLLESWEELVGRLDAPDAGRIRPMPGLEIVHVGVRGHLAGAIQHAGHLPLQALDRRRVEHVVHDEISVLAVELHIAVADHLGSPRSPRSPHRQRERRSTRG